MKNSLKYLLFSVIIFVFAFLVLEIGIRGYQKIARNIPFSMSTSDYHDKLLGWTGKKIFGNPDTTRKKLFVIGDSYTHGVSEDETKMYYRVIAKALDAELFVYGGSGYGNLQEYLVLDHYIDEIKPDLIIIQVCTNDFINNSYSLEKQSYNNNNLMVRPYLINGDIKYYYPRFLGQFRTFLISHSRALYMTFNGIDRLFAKLAHDGKIESVETKINTDGLNFKPFAQTKQITLEIFKKIKDRAGNTPIIITTANEDSPYHEQFEDIFRELNMIYTAKPAQVIAELRANSGMALTTKKYGHWDAQGHQIYGQILLQEIARILKSN